MESLTEKLFLDAFESHSDALFRHALYRVSDREKAYDLTQDTYMKTWDYLVQGGEIQNFKSFLFQALRNCIIDSYRKKFSTSLDVLLDDEAAAPAIEARMAEGGVQETEDAIDEKMFTERIHMKMSELPDTYREVLTLRYVDGFAVMEIAKIIGISENVVSVRIHRGVSKIRELCAQENISL